MGNFKMYNSRKNNLSFALYEKRTKIENNTCLSQN